MQAWADDQTESEMGALTAPVVTVTQLERPASTGDGPLALMIGAAQGLQRDPMKLLLRGRQIGELLGATGFYRFPVGGQSIEGVSVDLAQALAQEWGGIVYSVRILAADPLAGGGRRLHLRATVADAKSLVAAEVDQVVATSAPPRKFAAKDDQRERWHAMQAQSAASKIVRNAILRVLPAWYVEPAFLAAMRADSKSATGGKPLPEARKDAVSGFAASGLTEPELVAYVGQPMDLWASPQLGQLRDLWRELKDGRVSVEQVRADLAAHAKEGESKAPAGKAALGLGGQSTEEPQK